MQFDRIDHKSFLHLKMEGREMKNLKIQNLKRKISDEQIIISDFQKRICRKVLHWRNRKNRELVLNYKNRRVSLSTLPLPKLTNDALRCIFSFIPPWELLNLRFVCKQWNCVIVNTSMFWNLKYIETRNTFRDYVYHMFLNVRDESKLIEHFFARPDVFYRICRIVLGQERFKGKSTKYKLVFGNYTLSRRGEICTGSIKIKIQNFLEVYRQKICMHLPKSFQIRN